MSDTAKMLFKQMSVAFLNNFLCVNEENKLPFSCRSKFSNVKYRLCVMTSKGLGLVSILEGTNKKLGVGGHPPEMFERQTFSFRLLVSHLCPILSLFCINLRCKCL